MVIPGEFCVHAWRQERYAKPNATTRLFAFDLMEINLIKHINGFNKIHDPQHSRYSQAAERGKTVRKICFYRSIQPREPPWRLDEQV
jgi:hypothetical protein